MISQTSSSEIILDGALMTDRAAAHDQLARALSLPAHYGRNLDALYDCCTELSAALTLVHVPEMLAALGPYGERLLRTLREAAEANGRFTFREV